ncbi:MAG: CDP-alcohol phosphatidyltransferase family protein [Pirellulaceae bacterium]|jgi:phosphatidylglycerophosphate synthase|nr:CDP-alcohol phosphatidyltransferase family protein [Pirellulaceae bacterium]MDP7019378.1 CDP-alcohol phosphatidyltransferase family protein [Pirellulaceae bacterium]
MKPTLAELRSAYDAKKAGASEEQYFVTKWFYRPVSFYLAWLACQCGLTANAVTGLSFVAGLIGAVLFGVDNRVVQVAGALFLVAWAVLDHVDGNIARLSNKSSAYGDYLDTLTAYVVFAVFPLGVGLGASFAATQYSWVFLLAGAIAAVGNTLPRLAYQKMISYGVRQESYAAAFTNQSGLSGRIVRRAFHIVNGLLNPCGFLLPLAAVAAATRSLGLFVSAYALVCAAGTAVSILRFCKQVRAFDDLRNERADEEGDAESINRAA